MPQLWLPIHLLEFPDWASTHLSESQMLSNIWLCCLLFVSCFSTCGAGRLSGPQHAVKRSQSRRLSMLYICVKKKLTNRHWSLNKTFIYLFICVSDLCVCAHTHTCVWVFTQVCTVEARDGCRASSSLALHFALPTGSPTEPGHSWLWLDWWSGLQGFAHPQP